MLNVPQTTSLPSQFVLQLVHGMAHWIARWMARTAIALLAVGGLAVSPCALAQKGLSKRLPVAANAASDSADKPLSVAVSAALTRLHIPADSLSLVLLDPATPDAPRWQHRGHALVNPASLMKLVTTTAALELLGPTFTWQTPLYIDGPVVDGVLQGNLYVQGQGDPKWVAERLWLLMRRVQGLGVQRIRGDIVLDRTAFALPERSPADFDGEALRPYNAAPDALLINFKSIQLSFAPDPAAKVARVSAEPPLAGVSVVSAVPLVAGPCNDYRASLRADFSDPNAVRFGGGFPASCGEKVWPVAYADPGSFARRAVLGMWQLVGGQLTGVVRDGAVPDAARPWAVAESPTLSEVVRDINKFSNNVMAQQLFLTLSLQQPGGASLAGSRQVVGAWWRARFASEPPLLDNGSGLSRDERISAVAMARLLAYVHQSPLQPELVASLPISGLDGTLKRSRTQATAHLKTGSLRDVAGVAGFVHTAQGRSWVLVAIVNSAQLNSANARALFDALVDAAALERW